MLTLFLASILAFYLASILTFFLAFYLAYVLTFYPERPVVPYFRHGSPSKKGNSQLDFQMRMPIFEIPIFEVPSTK